MPNQPTHDFSPEEHEAASTKDAGEHMITLEGDDGSSYQCQLLGPPIEFEGKEYVLLLSHGNDEADEEEPGTVLMELVEDKDSNQLMFRPIESQEEFDRVVEYIRQCTEELALSGEEL